MAESTASLQKDLLQTLRQRLIPLARKRASLSLILGEAPVQASPGIHVSRIPLPSLHRTGRGKNYVRMATWHEHKLDAGRFPSIAFVLSGEIDMRIANITLSSTVEPGLESSDGYLLTGLKPGSALVFPPGVPHDSTQHWWRDGIELAASEILWMVPLPEGLRCHVCVTQGLKHTYRGWLLAHDAQALTLSELMIGELRENTSNSAEIAQSLLLTILLRLERSMSTRRLLPSRAEVRLNLQDAEPRTASNRHRDPTFQRAQQFIEDNLKEELSVAGIALHASVSMTQLNRVFRKETGTPVMHYVIGRRMDQARFFLGQSTLPIAEIGRLVGYPSPALFSNAFHRQTGVSPKNFRESKDIDKG